MRISRMNQRGDAEVWASLILAIIAVAVGLLFSAAICGGRWNKSGARTSWGPVQGCLVQTRDGRWVPEDVVREVDLAPAK